MPLPSSVPRGNYKNFKNALKTLEIFSGVIYNSSVIGVSPSGKATDSDLPPFDDNNSISTAFSFAYDMLYFLFY